MNLRYNIDFYAKPLHDVHYVKILNILMKFNVPSSWDKDKYERLVKGVFRKDKTLDFVKDDARIKFLLE